MTDDDEGMKFTLAGVVVGPYGVEVHPDFWTDLAKAPLEVQEAAKELIEKMREASRNTLAKYGPNATEAQFTAELIKLTGQEPEWLTDEDLRIVEEIERRHSNFPTKH